MQQQNNNPFQRNNRSRYPPNNRSDGSRGYQTWKTQKVAPEPPKEKVLTVDDFPALLSGVPTAKHIPDKSSWAKSEETMAEKMKERIAEEEARKNRPHQDEEDVEVWVIPLSGAKPYWRREQASPESGGQQQFPSTSDWMRGKYLAQKRIDDAQKVEMEAVEENYRWQISQEMIRPAPEDDEFQEMPLEDEEPTQEYEGYEENEQVDDRL